MNDKAKGYLLGVIASASYGMNPLFALPLYQSGMTPDEVLFISHSHIGGNDYCARTKFQDKEARSRCFVLYGNGDSYFIIDSVLLI